MSNSLRPSPIASATGHGSLNATVEVLAPLKTAHRLRLLSQLRSLGYHKHSAFADAEFSSPGYRVLPAANHWHLACAAPAATDTLRPSLPLRPAGFSAANPRVRDTAEPVPPAWVWPVSPVRLLLCVES